MTALVRAELIKLRSTRMIWWLLASALALVVLAVFFTIPTPSGPQAPLSLNDGDLLARAVGVGASGGEVVMIVLGILAFTQEARFGTDTATYLAAPRRGRVLAAKLIAMVLVGALFSLATLPVAVATAVGLIEARGATVAWTGEVAAVLAAAVIVMILFGAIGVAVGAMVQNQIAAVVGTLVWLLVIEQLLVVLAPSIGRWTPGGATTGLLQLGRAATTSGELLAPVAGGLVLCAYVAIIGAAASATSLRRDIA